ncbi:MAG: hypothetical protein ABEJ24_04180 [Candidatus Magasanikbacteria bacterium]
MLVTESYGSSIRSKFGGSSEKNQRISEFRARHRRRVREDLNEIRQRINTGEDPEEIDFIHVRPDEVVGIYNSPFW